MNKKIKRIISNILGLVVILCLSTQAISASTTSDMLISENVKKEINNLLDEYPSYSNFINGIVNSISEAEIANDADALNQYLMDLVAQTREIAIKGDEDHQRAVEKYEDNLNKATSRSLITYAAALAAYKTGIEIVKSKGCPNTARYMENAICGEHSNVWPNGIEDYNTDWAYSLVYDCDEFNYMIVSRFEDVILPTGANGTLSGSFAYTQSNSSLDAYTALHAVDYIVTFTKRADGNGYNAKFSMHDVFDFEWGNYDNFEVGFGNNYCYAMQQAGYIKPFDIYITVV